MKKICVMFRYAPIYRVPIYELIDQNFEVDFFFLKESKINIKKMDYSTLKNVAFLKNEFKIFNRFYFFNGINNVEFLKYDYILLAGDISDLTSWYIMLKVKFFSKKTKVILWTHGYYGKENIFIKIIKKIYYFLSDTILLYGDYARNLMIKNHISSDAKLKLIYNSLNYELHCELKKYNLNKDLYYKLFSNNYFNIIFVGRLTFEKKLNLLIEATKILLMKDIKINVTIIGSGDAKLSLVNFVKELNLDNSIKFLDEIYDEKILSEYFFNADLCVSPGNVGLLAIHSLTFGTPVISHNNFAYQGPEFEAVVENETGLFFINNDYISLSKTIERWISLNNNRDEVRTKCFKIIDERYNPNYQLNVLKNVFI